jgi:hypothetical protein
MNKKKKEKVLVFCRNTPSKKTTKLIKKNEPVKKPSKMLDFLEAPIIPEVITRKSNTVRKSTKKKINPLTLANGYDIFGIHNSIIYKFEKNKTEIDSFQRHAKNLNWIINNTDILTEKFEAEEQLEELKELISEIISGNNERYYRNTSEKLLTEYEQILEEPVEIQFMKQKKVENQKKTMIVYNYLDIAKEFIDIEDACYKSKTNSEDTCPSCGSDSNSNISDNGWIICYKCGHQRETLIGTSSYKDVDRVNPSSRYQYEKQTHFRDCINAFQAKQNTTIPKYVYNTLSAEIEKHQLKMSRVTKDHIYLFLRESELSNYYEDIVLIFCTLTKNRPPDISYLESQLYEMFDTIVPIFIKVKEKIAPKRRNFLNCQYVLYQFLRILRHHCDENDFSILKTQEKLIEHDDVFEAICNETSWTFYPTVG